MTAETGVMMLKIKHKTGILNCNINSQYQCIFDQIYRLVEHNRLLSKTHTNLLNGSVSDIVPHV